MHVMNFTSSSWSELQVKTLYCLLIEPSTFMSLFTFVSFFKSHVLFYFVCPHFFFVPLLLCFLSPWSKKTFSLVGQNENSAELQVSRARGKPHSIPTYFFTAVSHYSSLSLSLTRLASLVHITSLRLNEALLYLRLIEWKHRPGRHVHCCD